jgi:hypothetical protein
MKIFIGIILISFFSLTMISCSSDDTKTITEPVSDVVDPVTDGVADVLDPVADVVVDVGDVVEDTVEDTVEAANDVVVGESTNDGTDDISISNLASDNATVEFGQTYQHQITTSGTYSGTLTYSLSNQPDNMTISTSGLLEWTPTKASEITTHSDVVITITTANGYVLTQTYSLSVTGTCTTGNVLSIWSGDQRSSTDSSSYLGNITAYTDNSSSVKTASANYNYSSSSINLTHGPTASATKGNVFFYNQYNDTDDIYLFWMFGVNGSSVANNVHLDVYTAKNESSDNLVVSDDSGETNRESQSTTDSLYSSTYTGRYKYIACCSDGGVIGPFSGSSFRIFIDLTGTSLLTSTHSTSSAEDLAASGVSGYDLGTGNLDSFTYWSKDGSSFSLGDTDNFTVGYSTSLDCSN